MEVLPPRYAKYHPTSFWSDTAIIQRSLEVESFAKYQRTFSSADRTNVACHPMECVPPFFAVLSVQRALCVVTGSPQPRGTYFELDILFVIHRTNRCSPPLSYLYSNSKGQSAPWTRYRYPINLIITTPSISVRVSVPCQLPDLFLQICTESRDREEDNWTSVCCRRFVILFVVCRGDTGRG